MSHYDPEPEFETNEATTLQALREHAQSCASADWSTSSGVGFSGGGACQDAFIDEPTGHGPAARTADENDVTHLLGGWSDPDFIPANLMLPKRDSVRREGLVRLNLELALAAVLGLFGALLVVLVFGTASLTGAIPPVASACFGMGFLFLDVAAVALVGALTLRS